MSLGPCKRLIEVDLPIKVISEHARHEKNIRKGHISNLHMWWARRPLGACRAVVLGALFPDPVDPNCPEDFRKKAWELLRPLGTKSTGDNLALRKALLNFIGNFSEWKKSTDEGMLNIARGLVKAAHPTEHPLVIDPFAGGGAIPLEAIRVGADAFAIDYNPVAALLLKSMLEDIPRYGQRLVEAVAEWGAWVKEQAEKELTQFYPKDLDGSIPVAYLWTRTIRCEGPNCGAEVPLIVQLWLSKKGHNKFALKMVPNHSEKRVNFQIEEINQKEIQAGTVRRGSVTCPLCGYTTPVERVREQSRTIGLKPRLIAVVKFHPTKARKQYRLPTKEDLNSIAAAERELERMKRNYDGSLSLVPNEPTPSSNAHRAVASLRLYGFDTWGELFTARQMLALITFTRLIQQTYHKILAKSEDSDKESFARSITLILGLALSNLSHYLSNLSTYLSEGMISVFIQGQAIPMRWDFAEANPLMPKLVGGYEYALENAIDAIRSLYWLRSSGTVIQRSATSLPLPDNSASALITDPPYYDNVTYADLSDFFYVWLKRSIGNLYPELFTPPLTPKEEQIIVEHPNNKEEKRIFESKMTLALKEARRTINEDGVGLIVFAHKSTEGWEAMLSAIIGAGWSITSSWPIDTERRARMHAYGTASLASSVHLVCRPRPSNAGIGDWREVLSELQPRVHEWMQRLVKEDIVGADAIFGCIGPALEIFSRYDHVETAGGKGVELREYLEHVWAAVAREALNMIFEGADPTGFEEDARLTALWLWTLRTGTNGMNEEEETESEEEEEEQKGKIRGYLLEYDAARKIAQGLGAHLETLGRPGGIVEVRGKTATLLFVSNRRQVLFGEESTPQPRKRSGEIQMTLFEEPVVEERVKGLPETGRTILDKLHQAMLLFADGRSEALKRFLVEGGIGRDDRFWRLANALSALYPRNSEEKRWVDAVLSRKKALGF